MAGNDYADVQSVLPLLKRYYDNEVVKAVAHPHMTVDLIRRAGTDETNALMRQTSVEKYGNPNLGAGTAADGFRAPGSPTYAALFWAPVGRHITGGIDGDAWDNLRNAGRNFDDVSAERMASDFEMLWEDLNRGLFHGNNGERAVVDVTSAAPALSGGNTTVTFDSEWGVRHLNVGATTTFHNTTTNATVGSANGYLILSKDPATRTAVYSGDLTGISLIDGLVAVNLSTYNKDLDGLPEFLGNAGWYAGQNRDNEYLFRGNQVNAQSATIGVSILEKADTILAYINDGKYQTGRTDFTSPTSYALLMGIGWAQRVFVNAESTNTLGFTQVKYKDRLLTLDRDCSYKEWYMLAMETVRNAMLKEFGLFANKNGSPVFEVRSSSGTVTDKYHWVIFGKGQRTNKNPRRSLLIFGLSPGAADQGHVF